MGELDHMIKIKRVYEDASKDDGYRILVDRLWPRGVSKEKAAVDLWIKEIAPSNALRKWFSHEPEKWEEFRRKYSAELKDKEDLLKRIRDAEHEKGIVTLIYSAKDTSRNDAVVLYEVLKKGGI